MNFQCQWSSSTRRSGWISWRSTIPWKKKWSRSCMSSWIRSGLCATWWRRISASCWRRTASTSGAANTTRWTLQTAPLPFCSKGTQSIIMSCWAPWQGKTYRESISWCSSCQAWLTWNGSTRRCSMRSRVSAKRDTASSRRSAMRSCWIIRHWSSTAINTAWRLRRRVRRSTWSRQT